MRNLSLVLIAFISTACIRTSNIENVDKSHINEFKIQNVTEELPDNSDKISILELYTSQGCSSCPPADKVLDQISNSYSLDKVIPLSFHVDYWNRLGWKDPYSQKAFSERQRKYGVLFNLNSIYTPQVIIDSKFQNVGSKKSWITEHLKKASVKKLNQKVTKENSFYNIELPKKENSTNNLILLTVSKKEKNHIPRGENSGRNLTHTNVVKEMKAITSTEKELKLPVKNNHFYVLIEANNKMVIMAAQAIY